jgi:hypothetical protein
MNNRNFRPGPFQAMTPELLAQIAAAAFRPPPPMNPPSLPPAPHVRGPSLGAGLKLLEGLGKWKPRRSAPGAPRLMEGMANAPSASPPLPLPLPAVDFWTGQWNPKGGFSA